MEKQNNEKRKVAYNISIFFFGCFVHKLAARCLYPFLSTTVDCYSYYRFIHH